MYHYFDTAHLACHPPPCHPTPPLPLNPTPPPIPNPTPHHPSLPPVLSCLASPALTTAPHCAVPLPSSSPVPSPPPPSPPLPLPSPPPPFLLLPSPSLPPLPSRPSRPFPSPPLPFPPTLPLPLTAAIVHSLHPSAASARHHKDLRRPSPPRRSPAALVFILQTGPMRPDGETTIVYQKKQGYKMIRHYMMGDLLGEGQQGKVKEAIDSTSLRRVAIKIVNLRQLRKVCNGDSSAEEGVRRELSIHRKLKHPNVVELIEQFVLDEKQKLYAVLEYVPGGNLQDVTDELPDNVMPPRIASFLMRQLFVGLEYCHSQGVVHRDVKPSNVMVSTDGLLKITDFGVAEELQRYQDGDTTSKSRGSPAFQPPEVASGCQSFSGFKVDVWAAGVSLYLLMTGEVPFTGSSLINLFETIAKGEYIIPPRLQEQPELLSLVQGLLRVDHSSRLSVSEALNHPWLAEQERSQVWGHEERSVVQRTMHSLRSTAVLRAIARMYGEKFDDADDEGECTTVASAAFRSDGYDGLAAGSGPAGTSEIAARAGAHSSVVSSSKIAGEPAEKGVARVGKPVTAAEVNHANSASSASSCGVECHQGMDGGSESGPGKDGSQDCALS